MIVKKRNLNLINNLLSGIGIIVLGIIVTVGSIDMYTKVINLFVYVFLIYGISKLLNFILNKKIVKTGQMLVIVVINISFGFIMLFFPKIPLSILPIVFSIYLLFNSVVKFINYLILRKVKLRSRFKNLFFSMFFLTFSMIFLFYPLKKLNIFIMIIGIYCILLGVNKIYEFIVDILSEKYKLKLKKKLKMSLPVFLEAFLPRWALKHITEYIENITDEEKTNKQNAGLKVFIHISKYGFNQLGHMDIVFDGKVYSYGNYDRESLRLFTSLGDGVLFIIDNEKKYIDFCIKNNRNIVEYDIELTQTQKEKIKNRLNQIMEKTYEWEPLSKRDRKNKSNYKDYASRLYNDTKAKYYKFTEGEYKTFFVVGTNCSYFADQLMRNYVFEVLKLVGIISPGTYYEYLEENYRKKNSKVVYKKIYNKENIGVINDKNKK